MIVLQNYHTSTSIKQLVQLDTVEQSVLLYYSQVQIVYN